MAKIHASPKKSICRIPIELGIPKSTVCQILKQQKFHPYKLQVLNHLREDDPDRRIEMCEDLLPNYMKTSVSQKTVFCLVMKLSIM